MTSQFLTGQGSLSITCGPDIVDSGADRVQDDIHMPVNGRSMSRVRVGEHMQSREFQAANNAVCSDDSQCPSSRKVRTRVSVVLRVEDIQWPLRVICAQASTSSINVDTAFLHLHLQLPP